MSMVERQYGLVRTVDGNTGVGPAVTSVRVGPAVTLCGTWSAVTLCGTWSGMLSAARGRSCSVRHVVQYTLCGTWSSTPFAARGTRTLDRKGRN